MTCQQVQLNLSLYLYGELDFAREEELELHLNECSSCQLALSREKGWHMTVNSERVDVPLDFLAQCRRDLRTAVSSSAVEHKFRRSWWRWLEPFQFSPTRWSLRLAVASFLVILGFSAARWMDGNGFTGGLSLGAARMAFIDPSTARIRDIQPDNVNGVRIIVDQVSEREITGQVGDRSIRQLLLAAMKDPADPGIRVDSVELLKGQNGEDLRDALLHAVQHDPNAAVRLKALEALRQFASDPATRETLKFVLENDDNPGVRSEAIDVLAPANQDLRFNPDLAGVLQEIMRSERSDDYVRLRCMQVLHEMNAPLDVY
jgi:hypothetical protein